MRTHQGVLVLTALLLAGAPLAAEDELTATTWREVKAHVLPDEADLAWTKVPWRASLWGAVIEANRAQKPILLWAMNGHALACT